MERGFLVSDKYVNTMQCVKNSCHGLSVVHCEGFTYFIRLPPVSMVVCCVDCQSMITAS